MNTDVQIACCSKNHFSTQETSFYNKVPHLLGLSITALNKIRLKTIPKSVEN